MDSMPPATTMSNSPALISWSASAIASRPDRQTLLIVSAGTVIGMPAATAAWRAVIWPVPAWMTWPMITYSTWSGATPERSSARRDRDPAELGGGEVLERAQQASHRRAGPGDDHRTRGRVVRSGHDTPPAAICSADLQRYRPPASRRPEVFPVFTRIDHVGVAVPDLDAAIGFYERTFGMRCVHVETNEDQGVREAMLEVGDGQTQLQLLAPDSPDSAIARFLEHSGPGVQQIAYARRRHRGGQRRAARSRPAGALRRAAARHARHPGELRPPQGRRRGPGRARRASLER